MPRCRFDCGLKFTVLRETAIAREHSLVGCVALFEAVIHQLPLAAYAVVGLCGFVLFFALQGSTVGGKTALLR